MHLLTHIYDASYTVTTEEPDVPISRVIPPLYNEWEWHKLKVFLKQFAQHASVDSKHLVPGDTRFTDVRASRGCVTLRH